MYLYRVRVFFTGGTGGNQVCTQHFLDAVPATAQGASDALGDFFADIKGYISDDIRMTVDTEVLTLDVASGTTIAATTVTPRTFLGEDGGDPLPWQTQGLVKFPTGVFVGGRRLTGRLFVPGPCEGQNTGGVPNAGYIAALQSAADTLSGWLSYNQHVYSPTHHVAHPVNAATVMNRWASLRSRRD
jgi:hypothetical protein